MSKVYHRINDSIKAFKVRIVGENVESKIYPINDALKLAESLEVDLVEINQNSDPPICKLIRYDKFLFEEKRKQKEIEKKNREQRVDVKEIGLGPNTDVHDIDFKVKQAINFLTKGDKVKIVMKFVGREMVYKERGQKLMLEFVEKLSENGLPENLPKMEGKKMFIIIKPITKK
jgi:translation initiation factor IF-3